MWCIEDGGDGVSRCHSIDRLPKLWLPHFFIGQTYEYMKVIFVCSGVHLSPKTTTSITISAKCGTKSGY